MRNVAFISGPALGHVSRLFKIARALESIRDVKITFIVPDFSGAPDVVIKDKLETIKIPISSAQRARPFEVFGSAIEDIFKTQKFDLIVYDGCPVRWFSTIRFPDCPCIYVTNIFLTGLLTSETLQYDWFQRGAGKFINRIRLKKGMSPITSVFDLYDADQVLLSDPEFMAEDMTALPDNFTICGPISWSSKGDIPEALSNLTDSLVISMGSTGKQEISAALIDKLMSVAKCKESVYIGGQARKMKNAGLCDYSFDWAPLAEILPKASLVLTQGGSGSTYQALAHKTPVVILPTHKNQALLGKILEDKGLAICINTNDNLEKIDSFDIGKTRANMQALSKISNFKEGARLAAQKLADII